MRLVFPLPDGPFPSSEQNPSRRFPSVAAGPRGFWDRRRWWLTWGRLVAPRWSWEPRTACCAPGPATARPGRDLDFPPQPPRLQVPPTHREPGHSPWAESPWIPCVRRGYPPPSKAWDQTPASFRSLPYPTWMPTDWAPHVSCGAGQGVILDVPAVFRIPS